MIDIIICYYIYKKKIKKIYKLKNKKKFKKLYMFINLGRKLE